MRKLTDRVVRAAKVPERGSTYLWDEEIPGFGLRIYFSGRRSFVLRYGGRGQRRLMTLGEWGTLTLHRARQKAIRMRGRVLDGKDPLEEKAAEAQRARTEKADATHFRDVATLYMERHARPHRRSWREDERRIETYILPAIGHLALKDLKPGHIASLHAEIGRGAPVEANRVRELVRAVLNKARDWGIAPEGTPNPAAFRKGERFHEQSRERYVTRAELPALWSAIEQESNPYVKAAMKLYLFLGLRKTELLRTRWDEIDLERREWRVLRTKSGRAHVDEVPIPEPAAAILRDLPRTAGNPHVFPGARSGRHLVNINKSWRRVRRTAGLEDVTVHDLRRTVGSWLATSGTSLAIVGQVLGHQPGDVQATAVYARLDRSAAREALEKHASALMSVVNDNDHVNDRDEPVAGHLQAVGDGGGVVERKA